MLFVLSPAKALDYESPIPPALADLGHTQPQFCLLYTSPSPRD